MIYEKGSEVIGMLKTLVGSDAFRKGMDLYFDRHDGEATTVEAARIATVDTASLKVGRLVKDICHSIRIARGRMPVV